MPSNQRIEDYALISDCATAALVGRNGSIDWLCLPRFDSAACFAALLGEPQHGRWLIAPADPNPRVERRYLDGSLILVTRFETPEGAVELVDFIAHDHGFSDVVRLARGLRGHVKMCTEFIVRFDYGAVVPWVERLSEGGIAAIGGPERVILRTPALLRGEDLKTVGEFEIGAGETIPFVMSYGLSHLPPASPDRRRAGSAKGRDVLATLVFPLLSRRPLDRSRQKLFGCIEGSDLHHDGRHRRGGDDLAARAAGRQSELGLSILLAPRRDLHSSRSDACRLL
jgi:hypothetical protein